MSIRCITFDLDGVIVDSWQLMQTAFVHAHEACGAHGRPPVEAFRRKLGSPLPLIAESLGLPKSFVHEYESISRLKLELSAPFAGVLDILQSLSDHGYIIAINTGKDRLRAVEVLNRFTLSKHIDVMVAGDDVVYGKPHPESLYKVAVLTDSRCEEIAFVGDMPVDIQCARAAGVRSVAALWGMGGRAELQAAGADFEITSMYEVPDIIAAMSREGESS